MMFCASAAGYRDAYLVPGEGFIPPLSSLSHRSMFSEHPASLGSGSITLPGSLDGKGFCDFSVAVLPV